MSWLLQTVWSAVLQLGSKITSLCLAGLLLIFKPIAGLVMRMVRKGDRAAGFAVFVAKRFRYVAKRFGYKRAFRLAAYRVEQKLVSHMPQIKRDLVRFAPMALAVVIMVVAIHGWTSFTLAYEVNYDGNNIGYVASETVVADACEKVKTRVVEEEFNAKSVTYSLTVVSADSVNNADEICDNIIEVSNEIEVAMGLYIDGNLVAVGRDAAALEAAVSQVVAEYAQKTGNSAVSFANSLEYIGGVYPSYMIEEVVNTETLSKVLTVMKTVTETYEEEIEYPVQEVKDASQYLGYRYVKQDGKNGVQKVTANVSYVNGKEVSREILSATVVEEAVPQIVVVGAKEYSKANNTDTGTTLFWPVAQTPDNYISAYFGDGRNHKATADICAPNGTPIYAAEKGTVTYVGWESGYGYYLIIDHGNGLSTLYSHCSSISAVEGATVNRGDCVAAVGITGRASAYHLHFEIRVNGVAIDGRAYLGLD